jgi:hypothetical protein
MVGWLRNKLWSRQSFGRGNDQRGLTVPSVQKEEEGDLTGVVDRTRIYTTLSRKPLDRIAGRGHQVVRRKQGEFGSPAGTYGACGKEDFPVRIEGGGKRNSVGLPDDRKAVDYISRLYGNLATDRERLKDWIDGVVKGNPDDTSFTDYGFTEPKQWEAI